MCSVAGFLFFCFGLPFDGLYGLTGWVLAFRILVGMRVCIP